MPRYTCPACGTTATPTDVDKDTITGNWLVECRDCGTTTTMQGDLPESVARDPAFYTKTFCAGCGRHVPVEEVHWTDGSDWVVDDAD